MNNNLKLSYVKVLRRLRCVDKHDVAEIKMCNSIEEINDILFRVCEDSRLRKSRAVHCVLFKTACKEIIRRIKQKTINEMNDDEKEISRLYDQRVFRNFLKDACIMHDSFKFIDLWSHGELASEVASNARFPKIIVDALYYHSYKEEDLTTEQMTPLLKLFMDCDNISKLYPSFINCQLNTNDDKKIKTLSEKLTKKILKMTFFYDASKSIYAEKLPLTMDIINCRFITDEVDNEPIEFRNAVRILKEAVGDKLFDLSQSDYNVFNRRMIRYINDRDYHSIVLSIYNLCDGDEVDKSKTFLNCQNHSMNIGNIIREEKDFKRMSDEEIRDLENALLLKDLFKYTNHNVNYKQEKLVYEFIHALGFNYRICDAIKHLSVDKTNDVLSRYLKTLVC